MLLKRFILIMIGGCLLFSTADVKADVSEIVRMTANAKTFMIILQDVGHAEDFVDYAEILLKKSLQEAGAVIINPELTQKIKEDRLLIKAIENANASAMAKIAMDYGADILIRGGLSVDSRQKFAASWEGTAALSVSAIDTATAEEIANVSSDPFGSSANPSPIEDSPLIAKQMAVKSVCNNILKQLGMISDTAALKGATSIALELYDIFAAESDDATAIKLFPGGRYLLESGGHRVVMRDLEKKATLRTFQIKSGRATALAVASDDETFAVGDHRGVVHIFHVNAAKEIFELKCHDKEVTDLAFGPDNTLLVSSGRDGTIQLLNSRMGVTLAELKGHSGAVNSIAVTPDGRYVISAGNDLTIRMWDANVHQQKKSIQESADKLLNMVLSLDGSMVASSTVDIAVDLRRHTRKDIRHIKIRNTITGEEIRTLSGHKKDVTTLAFHPDKRFLASGSVDRSIRIWDLQMGEAVTVMQQEDAVQGVDFSNNGKWFAALSRNQRITVWKLR